jgi:hypothetical protein
MRVEIGVAIVIRPGVLEVLQQDCAGKPTVSRMRPSLEPGEVLQERPGRIPVIVKETPCHP